MPTEEVEYITLAEAAREVGIKRASIYYYIKELEIETRQYEHNKNAYIAKQDVERIKAVKEKPWKVSAQKPKRSRKSKDAA